MEVTPLANRQLSRLTLGVAAILVFIATLAAANSAPKKSEPRPGRPHSKATPPPCTSNLRELAIVNSSSNAVWLGGGGGAVPPSCVVQNGAQTVQCLPSATSGSADTACNNGCGTGNAATFACPGASGPEFLSSGGGGGAWICIAPTPLPSPVPLQVCGSDAAPNANVGGSSYGVCYFTLPHPARLVIKGTPAPTPTGTADWNYQLQKGEEADFCVSNSSVNYVPSPGATPTTITSVVWWGGNVYARTGCQPDGTQCITGDCSNASNTGCGAGVGGKPPATLAEFTLQRSATDFYDVSIINGANTTISMGPISGQTILQTPTITLSPTPTSGATPVPLNPTAGLYWCQSPGAATSSIPGKGCNWNIGKYAQTVPWPLASPAPPTDARSLLTESVRSCVVPGGGSVESGCPDNTLYKCTSISAGVGVKNGTCSRTCTSDADCELNNGGNVHCLTVAGEPPPPGQSGFCQCASNSECPGSFPYCGVQYLPGVIPAVGVNAFIKECGTFAAWWTVDDFCGNQANVVGPFSCGASIPDSDYDSTKKETNLATLLGCAGAFGGNPENGQSCYNNQATADCCGCATFPDNPLSANWPTPSFGTGKDSDGACWSNNSTWVSQVQPWLVNLKLACPTAYTYPYDDVTSTFQCQGAGPTNLLGYQITIGDLPKP